VRERRATAERRGQQRHFSALTRVRLSQTLCRRRFIAAGKFVVVVDNEDRENEGDLIIAAEDITAEKMAFLIRYTRFASFQGEVVGYGTHPSNYPHPAVLGFYSLSGLVCCAVAGERLDELNLPLMVEANTESHKTAFTHSVDYLHGPLLSDVVARHWVQTEISQRACDRYSLARSW